MKIIDKKGVIYFSYAILTVDEMSSELDGRKVSRTYLHLWVIIKI